MCVTMCKSDPMEKYPLLYASARDYLKFMRVVYKNKHSFNISPITLICVLNVNKFDVDTFRRQFDDTKTFMRIQSTPLSKKKRVFYNQISIRYADMSKKSIKLFSNGKVQITGLSSHIECYELMEYLLRLIRRVMNQPNIQLEDHYIAMINGNYRIQSRPVQGDNTIIDLHRLLSVINKHDRIFATYNPESYPAINAKYTNTVTGIRTSIFIFGTGSVVISAAKAIHHLQETYEYLTEYIFAEFALEHPLALSIKGPYIHGYPASQYMSAVGYREA